jgi:hypothetical protein
MPRSRTCAPTLTRACGISNGSMTTSASSACCSMARPSREMAPSGVTFRAGAMVLLSKRRAPRHWTTSAMVGPEHGVRSRGKQGHPA